MKNYINFNNSIRTYKISSKAQHLTVLSDLNEVIIGTLLGDASVMKNSINSNSRLIFKQALKNKEYIDHLYSLFEVYCGTRPRIGSYFDTRANVNKEYANIGFKTLCLPCFNIYRDLFYKFDGNKYRKVVPIEIANLLTEKSLAYWIMDDGAKSRNGFYLCTESFSKKENEFLINVLYDKFWLNCSIHKSSNNYRIYISSDSRNRLINLVKPYLLSHFYYKLDLNI